MLVGWYSEEGEGDNVESGLGGVRCIWQAAQSTILKMILIQPRKSRTGVLNDAVSNNQNLLQECFILNYKWL